MSALVSFTLVLLPRPCEDDRLFRGEAYEDRESSVHTILSLRSIAIPSRIVDMHPEWASCTPVRNLQVHTATDSNTHLMYLHLDHTRWLLGSTNNSTWRQ